MRPLYLLLLTLPALAQTPAPPQITLSNGPVTATLYAPHAQTGYYRGSRFDWSGVVASLTANGHSYFGTGWNEVAYSPTLHDAVGGPVEEFGAVGYEAAAVGGRFLKIGVGMLRKPDEPKNFFATPYQIVNGGLWTTNYHKDYADFRHELTDKSGYGYDYRKTFRLVPGQPKLILEHRLKNTGTKSIETDVYNHNFLMPDGETTGPDLTVTFPFLPQTSDSFGGKAALSGKTVQFMRPLNRGEFVYATLTGYGTGPDAYDIRVENRKSGAGVRVTGDRPLSKLAFWANAANVSPEPYIRLNLPPGQETTWTITYEFYALPR